MMQRSSSRCGLSVAQGLAAVPKPLLPRTLALRAPLRLCPGGTATLRRVGARAAAGDLGDGTDYGHTNLQRPSAMNADFASPASLSSGEDWVQKVREQGRFLASELFALKAEAAKKVASLTAAQGGSASASSDTGHRSSQHHEQQLVARLQSELEAARWEVEALQGEATATVALRDELAARTAALAATRDQLLRLEAQRTEELQASVARYAELEEALALAESSIDQTVDQDVAGVLQARVEALEAELADAAKLASSLTQQLQHAQQAKEEAERAQQEAIAAARRAQAEFETRSTRLANQKGEMAYRAKEAEAEADLQLRTEYEVAHKEALSLQTTVAEMREQVESLRVAASKGGREASLFRQRALKLQAQLGQHLFKADHAAQRAQQLEAALRKANAERRAAQQAAKDSQADAKAAGALSDKQKEMLRAASLKLQQLEADVHKAMLECDTATAALAEAMRGQHAAEQAQRAVQEQLNVQVAKVATLEEALRDQAAQAQAAAERERALEAQLSQQAQRAQQAAEHARHLDAELREQTSFAAEAVARARELEEALQEEATAAGAAEEKVQELQTLMYAEWSRAEEATQKARLAESQLASALERFEAEAAAAAAAQAMAQAELRSLLEEEKARSGALEGELAQLRREYERAERDLTALAMQAQRATLAADRSNQQLAGARDELAFVQAQLAAANAELEQLRASDQQKAAELAEAAQLANVLNLEISRLSAALVDKDSALQHWMLEAEQATQLAQAAVDKHSSALGLVERLQTQLIEKERERLAVMELHMSSLSLVETLQSQLAHATEAQQEAQAQVLAQEGETAYAGAFWEQLIDSQAQAKALREELAAARVQAQSADPSAGEAPADMAAFREMLGATQAAAQHMGQMLLALMTGEKIPSAGDLPAIGAGGAAAAAFADAAAAGMSRVVVRHEASGAAAGGKLDFISEEEVEAVLREMDLMRAELDAAVRYSQEAEARAEAAEIQLATLRDDFITEEEVVELLDHLDSVREELRLALESSAEVASRAEAAEAREAELQAELDAAAARSREAEGHVLQLKAQLQDLMAQPQRSMGGPDAGVGRRMRVLMQELGAAKAAAKTAEAAAEKLAGEKKALLQELAFGRGGTLLLQ